VGAVSFGVSRLVKGHKIASFILGGLVVGVVGGWLGYMLSGKYSDTGVQLGFTYGMIVGASSASYFSSKNKKTNIFWALTSTLIFITCISRFTGADIIEYGWDYAMPSAMMTILVGVYLIIVFHFGNRVFQRWFGGTTEIETATAKSGEYENNQRLYARSKKRRRKPRQHYQHAQVPVTAPALSNAKPSLSTKLRVLLTSVIPIWRSQRRIKLALFFFCIALITGLALWLRSGFSQSSGLTQHSSSMEDAEVPTILTNEDDSFSLTLNGCRKEYFNSEFHVTCQFYITNKKDQDYTFIINTSDSKAIDDQGVDHTVTNGQISEDALTSNPSKIILRKARIVARVVFDDVRRFKSRNLSLLRISIGIAGKNQLVEFNDIKINNARADASWIDAIFGE
jgi:uncharacterized protein with PQ loop repeat